MRLQLLHCTVNRRENKTNCTDRVNCLQWKLLSHTVICMQIKQDSTESCIDSWYLWVCLFFVRMPLFIHWLFISNFLQLWPNQPNHQWPTGGTEQKKQKSKRLLGKLFPPLQQIESNLTLYEETSFPKPRSPSSNCANGQFNHHSPWPPNAPLKWNQLPITKTCTHLPIRLPWDDVTLCLCMAMCLCARACVLRKTAKVITHW